MEATATIEPAKPKRLTVDEQLKVGYCIPTWLRDEQIRINIASVAGRIQVVESEAKQTEPIALVSYGPSLTQTWEKIRDFAFVMTCSGSHKFLTDRGIVPTHHIDVDPRKHKMKLIGEPRQGCQYLLASACHPDYVDWLKSLGMDVRLWHIFDTT